MIFYESEHIDKAQQLLDEVEVDRRRVLPEWDLDGLMGLIAQAQAHATLALALNAHARRVPA